MLQDIHFITKLHMLLVSLLVSELGLICVKLNHLKIWFFLSLRFSLNLKEPFKIANSVMNVTSLRVIIAKKKNLTNWQLWSIAGSKNCSGSVFLWQHPTKSSVRFERSANPLSRSVDRQWSFLWISVPLWPLDSLTSLTAQPPGPLNSWSKTEIHGISEKVFALLSCAKKVIWPQQSDVL